MIPEKVITPRLYRSVVLVANLLFLLVWYYANQGLSFWDDYSYLQLANEVNQGTFAISENHFTSRITVIYPVAFFIKYLGVSEYSMVVYPLLCALALLNLFFWLGHRINRWIGVLGGLWILCDYHLIYFSSHLFPEMPLTLCVFTMLMGYYLVLKDEMVPRFAGLLSALALFGAFLTKSTVVLLLPLLLFLFINDRRRRRHGSYWLVFVSLTTFFVLLNGFWYLETKGDFLYRFVNIANNHVATPKTFFDKDTSTILARLTYLPLLGFLKGGYFIPLLLALPAMLKIRKSHFRLDQAEYLWPLAALFLLAAFWFFSTSWRYYSPLPTEPRHIVYFIPVFIMSAATFWPHQQVFSMLKRRWLAVLGVAGFLCIPVYAILGSGKKNFRDEQRLVKNLFVDDKSPQVVITDGLTTYGHPYFYGFGEIEDKCLWFSELDDEDLRSIISGDKPVYLLINRGYFNEDYQDSENLRLLMGKLNRMSIKGTEVPLTTSGRVEVYYLEQQ